MNISDIIYGLLNQTKKVDIKKLPSQGFFYPENFQIKIKKVKPESIEEYKKNFDRDDFLSMIMCLREITKKHLILNKNYTYEDIKSIDLIYLFIELVKFTNNKEVFITIDDSTKIPFNENYFNYFNYESKIKFYDPVKKSFNIDDYSFSIPSIGIEDSITTFLMNKSDNDDFKKYQSYAYDFIYFLGDKNTLKSDEIENLLEIFNNDIEDKEKVKIKNIINQFEKNIRYSLKYKGKSIELSSKIDFVNIWN